MPADRPLVDLAKEADTLFAQIRRIVGDVEDVTLLKLIKSLAHEEPPRLRDLQVGRAAIVKPRHVGIAERAGFVVPRDDRPDLHLLDRLAKVMRDDAYDIRSLQGLLEAEGKHTVKRAYLSLTMTYGVQSGWLLRVQRGYYRMSDEALKAARGGLLWREWKKGRPDATDYTQTDTSIVAAASV